MLSGMSEDQKPKPRGRPPTKDQTVFEPLNVDPVQLARAMLQPRPESRPKPDDQKPPR